MDDSLAALLALGGRDIEAETGRMLATLDAALAGVCAAYAVAQAISLDGWESEAATAARSALAHKKQQLSSRIDELEGIRARVYSIGAQVADEVAYARAVAAAGSGV